METPRSLFSYNFFTFLLFYPFTFLPFYFFTFLLFLHQRGAKHLLGFFLG